MKNPLKKLFRSLSITVFLLPIIQGKLPGYTIFIVTGNNQVLVGNNEDFSDPVSYVWFSPATGKKYGRVFWSLSDKYPQGGMNEKGLFYDGVSAPYLDVLKSKNKPLCRGNPAEKMLEECGNVTEALELFSRYDLGYFKNGALFIADRSGDAAVIEGDIILRKKNHYFIQTNFYQSQPELGGYPCYRFAAAESILQESGAKEVSVDLIRHVLKGVSQPITQYSNICDLKKGIIYLFRSGNFSEGIRFRLKDELKKGKRLYEILRLFEEKNISIQSFPEIPLLNRILIARHPQGQKKSEVFMSNGKVGSVARGWHDNGIPAWEFTNLGGPGKGYLIMWHRLGYLLKEYRFSDGKYTLIKLFYPGGAKLADLSFEAGVAAKISTWNENGDLAFSGYYKNRLFFLSGAKEPFTGVVSAHFKNGQVRIQKSFKKGKKTEHLEWDSVGRALR